MLQPEKRSSVPSEGPHQPASPAAASAGSDALDGRELSSPVAELSGRILPPTASTAFHIPPQAIPILSRTGSSARVGRLVDYEILGELARSVRCVVCKARQISLNRIVVLKMLLTDGHPGDSHAAAQELARFRLEAEALGALQHPNIVQLFEIGDSDGRPFYSMEFVDDGSLADRLDGPLLPPEEAARLVQLLAQAIHAAHLAGIVHCDLKPANVLLSADGTPKITNFGQGRRLETEAGPLTRGAILGNPAWMAPEQIGERSHLAGPAADVYALGAILYALLTGRPPHQAATAAGTLFQILNGAPVPPRRLNPTLPGDLEIICLKCLGQRPAKRAMGPWNWPRICCGFNLRHEPIRARPAEEEAALGCSRRWWPPHWRRWSCCWSVSEAVQKRLAPCRGQGA